MSEYDYITREEAVERAVSISKAVPDSVVKRYATHIVVRTADNTKNIVRYHQVDRDTARRLGINFGMFRRMRETS